MAGASCILVLLALVFVGELMLANAATNYHPLGGAGSLLPEECGPKCEYRCSTATHKNLCLVYCNKCCLRCLCVPSGTSGNKEECPCYNNWKTYEGGPTCP